MKTPLIIVILSFIDTSGNNLVFYVRLYMLLFRYWVYLYYVLLSDSRVFGNEGYTESGSKLINFLPNFAPNEFLAFTINIRFHL